MQRRDGRDSRPHGSGEMTFEEIGRAMGITRGGAWMLYKSAIRKLRARKVAVRELLDLARSKDVVS